METILDAVRARTSVRAYAATSPDTETASALADLLAGEHLGPFGHRVRIELLDLSEEDRQETRHLGTYGFIKGARQYILCAIEETPRAREDLGFCFERVVLEATRIGLGTCWMGGTFKRGRFAERMGLSDAEVLPIISPVGIPAQRRSWRERVIRVGAGSDKRKPWNTLFFDATPDAPLGQEAAGPLAPVLEAVRLGPSASNKQPWRVVRDADCSTCHLFLQRTSGYDRMFGGIDLQSVDAGIAMCHLELVSREVGLEGGWQKVDPELDGWSAEYVASWVSTAGNA